MKHAPMDRGTLICHRLFVALLPPADVAAAIGEIRDGLAGKSPVSNDRLHMTMGLLDDMASIPAALIDGAREALREVSAAPIRICLDRVSSRGSTSALIPAEPTFALHALKGQISAAFGSMGLPMRYGWNFNPHVTLVYHPEDPRNEQIIPISWEAREFALVHSFVGLTRHVVLERFALGR